MLRNLQEISDGKIYGTKDMVRAACHDCEGCHACCEDMGTSIILDPYDIWNLQMGTGATFEELLGDALELHVVEGLILPNLKMTEERGCCHFLNEEGRCSIHANRPGLCRVFPLGRIYEEGQITYFLQADGCKKAERSKVKVEKWLDGAGGQADGAVSAAMARAAQKVTGIFTDWDGRGTCEDCKYVLIESVFCDAV